MTEKLSTNPTRYSMALDEMTSSADLVLSVRKSRETTGPAISELFHAWLVDSSKSKRRIEIEEMDEYHNFRETPQLQITYTVYDNDEPIASTVFKQGFWSSDPFTLKYDTPKFHAVLDLCKQIIARDACSESSFLLQKLWK